MAKLFTALEDLPAGLQGGALTVGNFDGVHRGHAQIVRRLCQRAAQTGGPAIVFTFEPHPALLLRPEAAPPPLTWIERKAELLGEQGVEAIVAYPTDAALLELSPREFFESIVVRRLKSRAMVEGPNFFFGKDRAGNVDTLAELCRGAGVDLQIVEPLEAGGAFISSSRVRDSLRTGDVHAAAGMLTRPYRIRGMVTHGAKRGSQIGFPTANIEAIDTLLPAQGVYAGVAHAGGVSWRAAVNIGPNPTFGEDVLKVEAHLIGFSGSLYGLPLEIDFLARLRGIRRFESVDALKAQLARDVEAVASTT